MGRWTIPLQVTTEELENRQAVLTAKVGEEWLEPYLRTASRRLAKRFDIPGFRKGKAPHRIVLRQMGREALIREVVDELGSAAYDEAVDQSGLEPIHLDDFQIAQSEPLTLRMTVSLKPTIELGDYRSTTVSREEIKVEENDVQEVLRQLQEQYGERVPVDRPAAMGDVALIDVEGELDGRIVLQLEEQEYELQADADFLVSDFAEKLTGMSVGDDRSFSLTFPDDYEDEGLAGQEVAFRVHVHNLQEKRLPEIDDELAKMVGVSDTLEELRARITEDLYLEREAEQKDRLAEELLDSLADQAEIGFPPVFVNSELEAMVRALALDLQEQGFTLEGYLNTTGRSLEDLLAEFRPTAERRVSKSLILSRLVEEVGVEVEDDEIEAELARVTNVYGQDTQAVREGLLNNEQVKQEVHTKLCGRKIVEILSEVSGRLEAEETAGVSDQGDESRTSASTEEAPVSSEESETA